jgi:hypothetical protein
MIPPHYLHIILGALVALPVGIAIGFALNSAKRHARLSWEEYKRARIFYGTRL